MPYPLPERNKKISTLIKWFVERKKGKVVAARKEIQRRFDYLDWEDQKKIILAFLNSGKGDRTWVYPHLVKCWDDEFMPIVKELFEKHHEQSSTWAIIRYFPTDYLLQHIEWFSEGRDYFFLCRRLAYDKVSFVVDKEKLSPREYLTVLIEKNDHLKNAEALDILFRILHDIATKYYSEFEGVNKLIEKGKPFVAFDFAYIHILFRQLITLNCFGAIKEFTHWNSCLYNAIKDSPEFRQLNQDLPYDYNSRRIVIAKRYIYRLLPEKYKSADDKLPYASDKEILERMKSKNPHLETLLDKLGLKS